MCVRCMSGVCLKVLYTAGCAQQTVCTHVRASGIWGWYIQQVVYIVLCVRAVMYSRWCTSCCVYVECGTYRRWYAPYGLCTASGVCSKQSELNML